MRFRLTTVASTQCDLAECPIENLAIDFRFRPSATLTVTAAFESAVRVLKDRAGGLVTCVVANDRTAQHLTRLLPRDQRPLRRTRINNTQVVLDLGNIVHVAADAVVNTSNVELTLGGGVSDAIRRACADASALQRAMHTLTPIAKGETVVTGAFGLPNAAWILHTATARGGLPVVERAFASVLEVAQARQFRSLAMPALGTGTGRVSLQDCAEAAQRAIKRSDFDGRVTFALYDARAFHCFERAFDPTDA